jgi:predicted ATPase/class 3 adenylate cyclase
MTRLPTGTVTFLFTDVEGSTRLLESLGERYADALAAHRLVLQRTCEERGGVLVDTQGDATFYAFSSASAALAAAGEAQRALGLPVRIGVHTGEPQLGESGYVGMDVHRAARICAAAHGGQVVVSQMAASALQMGSDPDTKASRLRDLGLHRLKDLAEPVRLFQLGEGAFPPPRTLSATNLPLPPTPLLGRKKELADLLRLLRDGTRLVTVTGPGGIGKTRFALEVAAELVGDVMDGVWFVDLSALRDPDLVLPTIAGTLGAKVELGEHLAGKELLLFLDNFEQVTEAAPALGSLLARCPQLRLLVTSREPLHLRGEREYPLRPLAESPAVELFRQRAEAIDPDFQAAYEDVAEICRRLDNLPLALELAAARTRTLTPDRLLERLSERLPLLASRSRDLPERQRTLRATIEWSYDLLPPEEQQLFRRLAVFLGGFTLEAGEEVCDADVDVLESLIEKSLLRHEDERFTMLETIREYALDRLGDEDELADMRRRHAAYFSALALEIRPSNLDCLDADYANLRATLEWFAETKDPRLLRLATQLAFFWRARGYFAEARAWLERAIERPGGETEVRGRALSWAATFARRQGDYEAAKSHARSRIHLGEEGPAAAEALIDLGVAMIEEGDLPGARPIVLRALDQAKNEGHVDVLYRALVNAGLLHVIDGDYAAAERELEDAYRLGERSENAVYLAFALGAIGQLRRRQGRLEEARHALFDSLRRFGDLNSQEGVIANLEQIAALLTDENTPERAVRLLAAANRLREDTGYPVAPLDREDRRALEERLQTMLDANAYRTAWGAGERLELADAVDLALSLK